jgi:hypothetical protein
MANDEHVAMLKQGKEVWNAWRPLYNFSSWLNKRGTYCNKHGESIGLPRRS